jgi:hypothetical protein
MRSILSETGFLALFLQAHKIEPLQQILTAQKTIKIDDI